MKQVAIKMIEKFDKIEQLNDLINNVDFIKDFRELPEKDKQEIEVAVYRQRCDILGVAPF